MAAYPEKLEQLVSDSVLEVLQSLGFADAQELDPRDQRRDKVVETFAASLDFSGAAMHGAVVVRADAALLAATHPQREYVKSFMESDHADWIGEVANLIVGALKRRTAGYRVDLQLGTPGVMRDGTPASGQTGPAAPAVFRFEVAGKTLQVDFHATLAPGTTFEGPEEDPAPAPGRTAALF